MTLGIGQRIRNKRIENNLTQEELAHKMGYTSKASISKVESGAEDNLSMDRVRKFADALGCSPAYLMGWEEADHSVENAHALADLMHDARLMEHMKKVMQMDDTKKEALYSYTDFLLSH